MNIHTLYRPVLTYFRQARMQMFYAQLGITAKTTILDVGGSPFIWDIAADHGLPRIESITCLNVFDIDRSTLPSNVTWVVGNGCELPFEDGQFDVVFSNSVIEHLGSYEPQRCFANEIRRVGKNYWVQTPDPRFFVEPHYLSPFVHWLPIDLRRKVARHGTTWGLLSRPSPEEIENRLKEIRLVAPREFKTMFPDAEIITERWLGMPKSLIAKSLNA